MRPANKANHLTVCAALMLLAGCAAQPEPVAETTQPPAPEPEVVEQAPAAESEAPCDCEAVAAVPENHFDRGVRALAARDYAAAQNFFELHREIGTEEARREAGVGIAFVAIMTEAASATETGAIDGLDERAEVMILALAAVQTLEGRIDALNALNSALTKDLEKREEALKRLRDLTLGQQEESP